MGIVFGIVFFIPKQRFTSRKIVSLITLFHEEAYTLLPPHHYSKYNCLLEDYTSKEVKYSGLKSRDRHKLADAVAKSQNQYATINGFFNKQHDQSSVLLFNPTGATHPTLTRRTNRWGWIELGFNGNPIFDYLSEPNEGEPEVLNLYLPKIKSIMNLGNRFFNYLNPLYGFLYFGGDYPEEEEDNAYTTDNNNEDNTIDIRRLHVFNYWNAPIVKKIGFKKIQSIPHYHHQKLDNEGLLLYAPLELFWYSVELWELEQEAMKYLKIPITVDLTKRLS